MAHEYIAKYSTYLAFRANCIEILPHPSQKSFHQQTKSKAGKEKELLYTIGRDAI